MHTCPESWTLVVSRLGTWLQKRVPAIGCCQLKWAMVSTNWAECLDELTRSAKKRAECSTRLTVPSFYPNMEPHKNQSQDDPYVQSSTACNRLWRGSPGSQWLCCPQFGHMCMFQGKNGPDSRAFTR